MLFISICVYLVYSNRTYFIWLQVGDRSGELTARLNLSDLQMVLGLSYSTNNSMMSESHVVENSLNGTCLFLQYFLTVNFPKNLFALFYDYTWLSMRVFFPTSKRGGFCSIGPFSSSCSGGFTL